MADAFEDRLRLSLNSLQEDRGSRRRRSTSPRSGASSASTPIKQRDRLLRCRAALHAAAVSAAASARPRSMPASTSLPRSRCAVDAPGVRRVLQICEEAKQKNLSVVSGLCLRYDYRFQETIKRIHDGQIGKIQALQANDYRGAHLGQAAAARVDRHDLADAELVLLHLALRRFQRRAARALPRCLLPGSRATYPVEAVGLGGRQVRTGAGVRPHLRPFLASSMNTPTKPSSSATAAKCPAASAT